MKLEADQAGIRADSAHLQSMDTAASFDAARELAH
jgi:hypothetical protein